MKRPLTVMVAAVATLLAEGLPAQRPPGEQGSSNIRILSHVTLPGVRFKTADIEIEQELSRPYAYVANRFKDAGFFIIDLKDPAKARILYRWIIENPDLHVGSGQDNKYVKLRGRYYDIQSFQFRSSGPDADLGAVIFDVTELPDTASIREVVRIRAPEVPGGFHNLFAYKHSDGRALLFATTTGAEAYVYDVERLVGGNPVRALVARVPVPGNEPNRGALSGPQGGYHDFYVGYDPTTRQDKFYGGGARGFYVYDVSRPEAPKLVTSVTGVAGVANGHTFTPTPDGRYALAMSAPTYQHSPMRMFDLKPGLDGDVETISRPVGAWIAKWNGVSHNHEVRWPYAFIAAQDDALQVLNIMDPSNPYTVAYYDTKEGPELFGRNLGGAIGTGGGIYDGVWGIDVRNADGLIVVSDYNSGFWAFKMNGFDGWNGHQWGMPNVSSAQDWDNGPDGAPEPARISTR